MYARIIFLLFLSYGASSCAQSQKAVTERHVRTGADAIVTEQLNLTDPSRNRMIPVVLYRSASPEKKAKQKLAILNHGYGGQNTAYTFIAHFLVEQGYLVASIQHELPNDAPLPMTGNVYETRLPHWSRGVQNIRFVQQKLPQLYTTLDSTSLLLVGHSNGGDMTMLFAQQFPDQVQKVISLDNRRVPVPRDRRISVLTLRSSDQSADAGVLPTTAEQEQYGIRVIQLQNTLHNDMWDGATPEQKQEMLKYISQFLLQR